MLKIRLMNEYLHGPIWVLNSEGISVWKCPIVEQDHILRELNKRAMEMFNSYYEFNSHDLSAKNGRNAPCWFNAEKEKAEKDSMLNLISQIKDRLEEIDDGNFIIEDLETERLKNL